ncbi:hypothetical protein WN943_001583 [Citrus x changshan-huyou]
MGRIFVVELDGRSYRCKFCRTHLALPEDLVSRKIRIACEIMNGVEIRNLHLKDVAAIQMSLCNGHLFGILALIIALCSVVRVRIKEIIQGWVADDFLEKAVAINRAERECH